MSLGQKRQWWVEHEHKWRSNSLVSATEYVGNKNDKWFEEWSIVIRIDEYEVPMKD